MGSARQNIVPGLDCPSLSRIRVQVIKPYLYAQAAGDAVAQESQQRVAVVGVIAMQHPVLTGMSHDSEVLVSKARFQCKYSGQKIHLPGDIGDQKIEANAL